jgi:hypothetical protein
MLDDDGASAIASLLECSLTLRVLNLKRAAVIRCFLPASQPACLPACLTA